MRKSERVDQLAIFLIFFTFFAIFTKTEAISWSDAARMATIESLVERGTFVIDQSTFNWTGDKVFINGHFYGGFAPVFPFLSSGVYFILNKIFNLSFLTHHHLCYYLITLFTVGVATNLMLVFFYRSLKFVGVKRNYRWLLVTALAVGTLVFCYSAVFNYHIVCASLLSISLYFILKPNFLKNHLKKNIFITGFFVSLTATISHPAGGIFLIMFFVYLIWSKRLRPFVSLYIMGSLVPMLFYLILNIPITGDIRPVNAHPEFYSYPGSFFDGTSAERTLSGAIYHKDTISFLKYAFHCLFGKRGLFLYTPLLFFSLAGLIKKISDKRSFFRKEAAIIALGCFSIIVYYIIFTVNYAGSCYGIRWFVEVIPLLFFFTAFFFKENSSIFSKGVFYLVLVISLAINIIGVYGPWYPPSGHFSLIHNIKIMKTDNSLFDNFCPIVVNYFAKN